MRLLHDKITTCFIFAAALLFWYGGYDEAYWVLDSRNYDHFADAILSGEIFVSRPIEEVPDYRAWRTPGFPIVLAIGKLLGAKAWGGLKVTNILLASLVGVSFIAWPVGAVPPLLKGVALFLCFFGMQQYFPWMGSEWTALCFILLLVPLMHRYFREPSGWLLLAIGLLCSFCTLIRVAQFELLVIPFALALFTPGRRMKFEAIACSALLPILAWMAFNYYSIGQFKVVAFGGYNLYGVFSLIGEAEEQPSDPEDLKLLIRETNKRRQELPEEPCLMRQLYAAGCKTVERYNFNIWFVGHALTEEQGWSSVRANDLMSAYALRMLSAHTREYLDHVATQLGIAWQFILPLNRLVIVGGLAALAWSFARGRPAPLALTLAVMWYIHLSHCLLVAAVEIMIGRYHDLTFYPLLLVSALFLIDMVITRWAPRFAGDGRAGTMVPRAA